MNIRSLVARVEQAIGRQLEALPALPAPQNLPMAGSPSVLANELAKNFGELVRSYEAHYGMSPEEARAKASESNANLEERALHAPPEEMQWWELHYLAERDPKKALQRWEEVIQAARQEVRSGERAARAIEGPLSDAWTRARFLALHAELAAAWQPRNGQEMQLIDQLAQAQTLLWEWQKTMTNYTALANQGCKRAVEGHPYEPPLLSMTEAVEHATANVERYQRFYLRALRALVELRRLGPRVVVRRAGQVNIAGQQINVAGPVVAPEGEGNEP
jgi:hypothetical protein